MKKGVIVELKEKNKVVLGDNGRFYVLPAKKGDNIGGRVKIYSAKKRLAAFLCGAFLFMGTAGGGYIAVKEFNSFLPDTLIRIEINPSVEFLVNGKGRVVSAAPLNTDAAIMIADKDYSGKSIYEVAGDFATAALACGFINVNAECSAVFVYALNDSAKRQNELGLTVKNILESVFAQNFVKAVIINNAYTPSAAIFAWSAGCEVNKFRAVYTVSKILEKDNGKELGELLQEYKNASVKSLCGIIKQAHIKYYQNLSDEKRLIFKALKNQYVKNNKIAYNSFLNNPEIADSYEIWQKDKKTFEQDFAVRGNEIALPLYFEG